MPTNFVDLQPLKKWFLETKRDFPWRDNPSPYAVWVSEVMLQQTQAVVVVPYFERWMEQFPTLASLAQAPIDQVIKAWEGLGYYSRARNLHAGAQRVVDHFGGQLPDDFNSLKTIKGLGPYTIGAILSFAFHKKIAAVDGNVIRVLSRLFMVEEDISKPKTIQILRSIAEEILPDEDPWVINEALIELGATVCTKQAKCPACPLKLSCQAYRQDAVSRFPFKSQKITTQSLNRVVMVILSDDYLLVQRRQKGEIMSDLHEFPFIEVDQLPRDHAAINEYLSLTWGLDPRFITQLPGIKHSFTRYRVHLTPMLFHCTGRPSLPDSQWMLLKEAQQAAFSSGHRRILNTLSLLNLNK